MPPLSAALPSLPCAPADLDEFIGRPHSGLSAAVASAPGPFLVLGAGGKLGLHLTIMLQGALQAAGRQERVLAVSRFNSLRGREDFSRFGLETAACDLENPAELAALPEAGTVFFLAGVKFGTQGEPDLLQRLNIAMPALVAERYRRGRIVAFSSGAVYPFTVPPYGATEEMAPAPVGLYAASCLAREEAFVAASRRHGTPTVLIRLNYAVEFRYGVLVDIAEKIQRGEAVDLTMGYVNVIWQGDAVDHSIRALALAATPPAPLNVTGAAVLSVRDVAQRFGRLFGVTPCFTGKEADTALLSDATRSHRLFGPPTVGLDEMIAWTAAWLGRSGSTWGKPTRFERRDGRY